MWGSIINFLSGNSAFVPNIAWLVVAVILIVTIASKLSSGDKKAKDEKESDEKKTKKKRKISFAWLGKPFQLIRSIKKDDFVYWFIWPGANFLLIALCYFGHIHLGSGEIFWLVVLNLAIIIFATRSRWFRILTFWVGSIAIIVAIGFGISTLVDMGTPRPYEEAEANLWLVHDVSKPRWTATSIIIPDNCMLEISASGTYYWDTADSRGPCGPEGMHDPNSGKLVPTRYILRPEQFLPELLNDPFAGFCAKVGDNEAFFVGKHCVKYIKHGGTLFTGINIRWCRTGGMRGFNSSKYSWTINWQNAEGEINADVIIMSRSEWEKKQT